MDELLTCSVCCERYCEAERQPVVLPRCGHSFCRPCVTLLLNASCIICPTCRTDQRIESAHRLPTEFTLLAIIAAQDNSKLDNCQRHDVKLSFWCKTCSKATCGECLFEDHPTHSHDVIRSLTYIKNIKDSVHEVGCKFMEALDTREQSYYSMVYNCAKQIDEALRNVTVLRKDMGEAHNLMKGVKVDECNMTMSTATTLAEAAKYLGLKWNIQDANFNRSREKEIEAKKEEEESKKEEETKTEEEPLSKKDLAAEEKEKRKERIRERRRKKLALAEKEKEKAMEQKTLKEEVPPVVPEVTVQSASVTSMDAESVKDVKKKTFGIRKSKTLAVFEPFSMDKEINGIKEKIAELDNRIRERIEIEEQQKIDDEEEVELNKKILEEKAEEARKEAEAAVEKVKAVLNEKEKALAKEKFNDDEEYRKKAEEQEKINKAAEEELKILDQMIKNPMNKRERKDLLDAENSEIESNKLASDSLADNKPEDTESIGEKSNGEPEHTNKDEGADGAVAVTNDSDPYTGEMSPEEKEAKRLVEIQKEKEDKTRIFDFMKEPLFSLCVEGAEGRLAMARWEPRGIHVYSHQFQQLDYDIVIRSNVLLAMIPSKNPIVFLELTVGTSIPTRIYIKLWGQLRRAHNFLGLCMGDQGSSLLNTKLLQVYNLNEPGERILGGDHEYNTGRGGCALLEDLEWNGDYSMPMQEGLLTAAGSGQRATNSLFLICTRGDVGRNFSCPFGEVVDGLGDVRDAIAKSAAEEEEIWITDCGVVLEPPH